MINQQNMDEESFKWAVIVALHHEDTRHHPERISLLGPYENQYKWKGLGFPVLLRRFINLKRTTLA